MLFGEVIIEKHGVLEEGGGHKISHPFTGMDYRGIFWREWEEFNGNVLFRAGEGITVSFWGHMWCENNILSAIFPNTVTISCQNEMPVQQMWKLQGGKVHLDLRFRWNLQDWEVIEFQNLVKLLQYQRITQVGHDAWRWGIVHNGVFTVKSYYEKLLIREELVFVYLLVWIPRIPRKVCCFTWLAARAVILIAENLRKRKINVSVSASCAKARVITWITSYYIIR